MDAVALAGYRRAVAETYAAARTSGAGPEVWTTWRERRDRLIATHPESPLPLPRRGAGWRTPFFAHDPTWRLSGRVEATEDPLVFEVPHSGSGMTRVTEIGTVRAERAGTAIVLTAFWVDVYGGGIFLPFRDGTCGTETYGGGRYLLDTIKGADLGLDDDGHLVLDFNYAYHPSCAWDPTWSCPLAPPGNALGVDVRAGERLPLGRPPPGRSDQVADQVRPTFE